MDNKNFIQTYDNAIPDSLCDDLIQKFESNKDQWENRSKLSSERSLSFNEIHLFKYTDTWKDESKVLQEIFTKYIDDYKKLYLGSSQDVEIYHSSGNVTLFNSPTNRQVQLKGDGGLLIRASGNQNIANFVQSGVTLYHSVGNAYTARFVTTSKGITVTGEVAASQDFPVT